MQEWNHRHNGTLSEIAPFYKIVLVGIVGDVEVIRAWRNYLLLYLFLNGGYGHLSYHFPILLVSGNFFSCFSHSYFWFLVWRLHWRPVGSIIKITQFVTVHAVQQKVEFHPDCFTEKRMVPKELNQHRFIGQQIASTKENLQKWKSCDAKWGKKLWKSSCKRIARDSYTRLVKNCWQPIWFYLEWQPRPLS